MRKILRPKIVFDTKTGMIPVGHTKFDEDFVMHDEADPFIPIPGGGQIRRMRLVNLGTKARGVLSDEVERVIAELAALPHVPYRISESKGAKRKGAPDSNKSRAR